jgi:uncharacterized membrane protein
MRIHQIRYVENVVIYDLIWLVIAVGLVIGGLVLAIRTRVKNTSEGTAAHEHG